MRVSSPPASAASSVSASSRRKSAKYSVTASTSARSLLSSHRRKPSKSQPTPNLTPCSVRSCPIESVTLRTSCLFGSGTCTSARARSLEHLHGIVGVARRRIDVGRLLQAAKTPERRDLEHLGPARGLDHVDAGEVEFEQLLRSLGERDDLLARLVRLILAALVGRGRPRATADARVGGEVITPEEHDAEIATGRVEQLLQVHHRVVLAKLLDAGAKLGR